MQSLMIVCSVHKRYIFRSAICYSVPVKWKEMSPPGDRSSFSVDKWNRWWKRVQQQPLLWGAISSFRRRLTPAAAGELLFGTHRLSIIFTLTKNMTEPDRGERWWLWWLGGFSAGLCALSPRQQKSQQWSGTRARSYFCDRPSYLWP